MVLELGCGSGYVVTSVALLLQARSRAARCRRTRALASSHPAAQGTHPVCFSTDVNPRAAAACAATAGAHGPAAARACCAGPVVCDLASPLLRRLAGAVDVLLFNPPYVPSPADEVGAPGLGAALAGGPRGASVLLRLLASGALASLLAPGGAAYVVVLAANGLGEVVAAFERAGLPGAAPVLTRAADEERLYVVRAVRQQQQQLLQQPG